MLANAKILGEIKVHPPNFSGNKTENHKVNNGEIKEVVFSAFPNADLLKAMYVQNNETNGKNPFFQDLTEAERQNVNASTLNKQTISQLTRLMQDGFVDANIFKNLPSDCEFEQNILKDISLIQSAKDNNIPVEDAYIPEYSSIKEFYKKGDTRSELCSINGEVHYNAGYTLFPLKMDKRTYIKLFPPLKRFTVNQQDNGDCYLVSALTNIYNNPKTRIEILSCFKQDGNDIKVKLPNSKNTYTIKDGKLDDEQLGDKKQFAQGPEWIKILEYVYGLELRNEYAELAKDKTFELLDTAYTKKAENEEKIANAKSKLEAVKLLQQDLNEYEKVPQKNDYIKQEIDSMRKRIEELDEEGTTRTLEIYECYQEALDLFFNENINNKDAIHEAVKRIDDLWIGKNQTLGTTRIALDYHKNIVSLVRELATRTTGVQMLDAENVQSFKDRYKNNINYYREGGNMCEPYLKLGFHATLYNSNTFDNPKDKQCFINDIRNSWHKDGFVTGATKANIQQNKKRNLVPNHAYNIDFSFNQDGSISYYINNPHNTAVRTKFTEQELLDNFDCLAIIYP